MARILVVDDEQVTRVVVPRVFSHDGHVCDAAEDGVEGERLLRSAEYDIAIVNLKMPRTEGDELIRRSRHITEHRIPVLLESGTSETELEILARGLGVDAYMTLPFDLDGLRELVRRLLDRRRGLLRTRLRERATLAPVPRDRRPTLLEVRARRERESALRAAIEGVGLPAPSVIRWCASPSEGLALATAHVRAFDAGSALRGRLAPLLGADDVGPIDGDARSDDGNSLCRAALEELADEIHRMPEANRDAPLLALLDAIPEDLPRSHAGPSDERLPRWPADLARHVGWLWSFDTGFAVATLPRIAVRTDEQRRLHSDGGPAIEYEDGSGVFAHHGFRVPERFVLHPETLTPADVRAPRNAELRRIFRERLGEDRYLAALYARVVHVDSVPILAADPAGPSITRALVEDATGVRTLVASDGSTNRVYHMRVPRSCSTCAEASAALAGREGAPIVAEA